MRIPFTKYEIVWREKAIPTTSNTGQLQGVSSRGTWWPIVIRESFPGAWQNNVEVSTSTVTTNPTLFSCVTLIAGTVSKMRMRLVQEAQGVWQEVLVGAFSPVLRRPNHYQYPQQFFETWILSKLLTGNAYILKVRDNRNVVVALYPLDPNRVRPLVAPNGDVFYQLSKDDLSKLPEQQGYVVPATEIIHDRWNCLFHPLVGLSPIYACGAAAVQGLNIQNSSTRFFGNGGNPGGVIEVPGAIDQEAADRIKAAWDEGFSGDNSGKVAVIGDGMKYTPMKMSAVDSQLIDQLKWTGEQIASCYHVPFFMVSSASYPPYNSVVALQTMFYSMCIQELSEAIEQCLDNGLGLLEGQVATERYGTEFDVNDLFTMDLPSLMETVEKGKNYLTPNDGRRKINLPPVAGGNTVYRQQQDYSLEALSKRDAKEDPFAKTPKPVPAAPPAAPPAQAATDKAVLLQFARPMAKRFVARKIGRVA
jgi:HK97 family phage portal protein